MNKDRLYWWRCFIAGSMAPCVESWEYNDLMDELVALHHQQVLQDHPLPEQKENR